MSDFTTRNVNAIVWWYQGDLGVGANLTVPIGGPSAGYDAVGPDIASIEYMNRFGFDMYCDQPVQLDVETGVTTALLDMFVTLTSPASPAPVHVSVYDLPPPHNKDGYLIPTNSFMRLQIQNVSGEIVSPFAIFARVWRE